MTAIAEKYPAHVAERRRKAEAALAAAGFEALVIHAGTPFTYFADDQDAPFRPTPHFAHWLPLAGPAHLLVIRPGARPALVRVAPEDYWYEQLPLGDPFWRSQFDVTEVPEAAKAWAAANIRGRMAFIGDAGVLAEQHGIAADAVNPPALLARLDWDRSLKTAYEVACLEEATVRAAKGHRVAKQAFEAGRSELEIHHDYMAAIAAFDSQLPYGSIVALNEKGATLHYEAKRDVRNGKVLLIDSGALHLGYGSDITRTWTTAAADPVFRDLVAGVDALQKDLCQQVKPGLLYTTLHHRSHVMIADLLKRLGIIRLGGEEGVAKGLTLPFFPHGLGHFLGIQVHDVSGRQKDPSGGTVPPPPQYPYLRTTRTITEHMCFTIEPGVYFIEMLLRERRKGADAALYDWTLIDRLMSCGGVRIEDNLVVTADGHRNLTRPHI